MSAALDVFASDLASQENDPMSTVIPSIPDNAATRLQENTLAVKVSFTWFGQRKSLSDDQKAEIAAQYDAEKDSISVGKRLFAKHPALTAIASVKGDIRRYWEKHTLPFPEKGKRLLPKSKVADFRYQMEVFRDALQSAVNDLNFCLYELKSIAREKLGSLYDERDYPDSFDGKFTVEWEFSDVRVPSYLMALDPETYEQERRRVAAQFDAAIRDAEQEFIGQFATVVQHITERLTPNPDGTAKTFKHGTIDKLTEFFERFRALDTGSDERINALVEQAREAIQGKSAKNLRANQSLRDSLRESMEGIANTLDGMLIDRPRRRIIRDTATATASDSPETTSSEESAESAA